MQKVVFYGGNSKIKGFKNRLISECDFLWKNNILQNKRNSLAMKSFESFTKEYENMHCFDIKTDPSLLSYQGMYMISKIIQPEQFITLKEYKEVGIEILRRKNLSKTAFK